MDAIFYYSRKRSYASWFLAITKDNGDNYDSELFKIVGNKAHNANHKIVISKEWIADRFVDEDYFFTAELGILQEELGFQ